MNFDKYSLLDQLIDKEQAGHKVKKNNPEYVFALILRRDLENLLNTYKSWWTWPEELVELNKSIINYGIDDISYYNLNTIKACEDLCAQLEQSIQLYETRLNEVKVKIDEHDQFEMILKLRIEAIIEVESMAIPIIYRSTLDQRNGKISIITENL